MEQDLPQAALEAEHRHDESGVVLLLQVPRTNEKKELAAEQMFASLHGLLTIPLSGGGFFGDKLKRERISMEIAVREKRIGFYIWVPQYLKGYVEEQVYAQYPTVQISEVEDYALDNSKPYSITLSTEMKMTTNDVLPIKTFQSFEVDPLAAITATLAKFEQDEEAWVQLLIKPAPSTWHRKSEKYQTTMKGGGSGIGAGAILRAFWQPPEPSSGGAAKLADHEQVRVSASEEKSQKLAFECSLRIVYRGNVNQPVAKLRIQSIIASYKQFNTTYLNGFDAKRVALDPVLIRLYQSRTHGPKGFMLNIEETATLYHLPHTNVETPFILWASSQTAEPPANLPIVTGEPNQELSPIGTTNFRGHNTVFGLRRTDRTRHLYIIGQTGVGKSGLLELLTISDIYSPYGFAVIDPHGDYAQHVLERIPAERARDVIYFNPADVDFPMAFNPMEVTDQKLKTHTASELIGVLKRMFESWGPRLEYILRYSLLALLDYPDATMLDITRVLTDKKFRQDVIRQCGDPVVRNFWEIEFASWNDKFAAEAVAPVLNKVGAFTANPLVRNIIGQPKSSFNIRKIMDERKILIVNLSRGLVGEDNAALLGSLLVTKIQLAAMGRADIHADERSPFYLYVDEFQNFATDSFATILSEARKYGLNLTVANQYTAQMSIEVKDAVFGNVGSIIAFRMGADDAGSMTRYFEPKFLEYDLVHMHNRHFVISLTIEGEKVPAFSAISLNLPPIEGNQTDVIIANSRSVYASSRPVVEAYVNDRYLTMGPKQSIPAQASRSKNQQQRSASVQAPTASRSDQPPPITSTREPHQPTVAAQEAPRQTATPRRTEAPAVAVTKVHRPVTSMVNTVLSGAVETADRAEDLDDQPIEIVNATNTARRDDNPRASRPESNGDGDGTEPQKPKRKRTRKRKRKPVAEGESPSQPQTQSQVPAQPQSNPRTAPQPAPSGSFDENGVIRLH
jgi:hypothetical protein